MYIDGDNIYENLPSSGSKLPAGDGLMVPLPYLALIASMIIMLSATFYIMFGRSHD
jgi:hypothetical protein